MVHRVVLVVLVSAGVILVSAGVILVSAGGVISVILTAER